MKKLISLRVVVVVLVGLVHLNLVGSNINQAEAAQLKIKYGYDGQFGPFRIADTAEAYIDDVLVGRARAVRIIKKSPGPNHILISEVQYNSSGSVIYQGEFEVRFGFGGGTVVSDRRISGTKRYNLFGGWPSGN